MAQTKVPSSQIDLGAQTSSVATLQTTSSTTYVDLATVGPSVTVTIAANGMALVGVSSLSWNGTAGSDVYHSFAISGATTAAATDLRARTSNGTPGQTGTKITLVTGLNPGSTTFTSKYRASANNGNWLNRDIFVIPL